AVLVAELLRELLAHDLFEMHLQSRHDTLLSSLRLRGFFASLLARPVGLFGGFLRLLRLLGLVALLRPRCRFRLLLTLCPFGGLGFRFALDLSHRSRLPTVLQTVPSGDAPLRRRI